LGLATATAHQSIAGQQGEDRRMNKWTERQKDEPLMDVNGNNKETANSRYIGRNSSEFVAKKRFLCKQKLFVIRVWIKRY